MQKSYRPFCFRPNKVFDEHVETASMPIVISTMHLRKGMEFQAVVVLACVAPGLKFLSDIL